MTLCRFHASQCALGQVGLERRCACHESEDIHIGMTAATQSVHQTGLGGGADLVKHCLCRQRADTTTLVLPNSLLQDGCRSDLQLLHAMGAARATDPSAFTADQALSVFLPTQLLTVGCDHIHVKEPPKVTSLLDLQGQSLDLLRRGVYHIKSFAARVPGKPLFVENRHSGQLGFQLAAAYGKALCNEGAVLYRTCDVHGKADKGLTVLFQEILLFFRPAIPGLQNFLQRGFHITSIRAAAVSCPASSEALRHPRLRSPPADSGA